MTAKILPLGFAVLLASACPTEIFAQTGRPASASDVSGKTICWNDGGRGTYAANGQFTNRQGAHTTWSVPAPGVIRVGSSERQTEVLADGRLHVLVTGRHAIQREYWGTACN